MKLTILIVGLLVSGLLAAAYFEPSADASHIKRCLGEKPTMKNRSHDPSGSFLVGTVQAGRRASQAARTPTTSKGGVAPSMLRDLRPVGAAT